MHILLLTKTLIKKLETIMAALVKKKKGSWKSSVSLQKFYLLTKKIQILFP